MGKQMKMLLCELSQWVDVNDKASEGDQLSGIHETLIIWLTDGKFVRYSQRKAVFERTEMRLTRQTAVRRCTETKRTITWRFKPD